MRRYIDVSFASKCECLKFSFPVDLEDSRQFIEGRRIQQGEKVPKHAPIGYCDSKLMNAIFARELSSKHKDLTVICVGPGWCKTELARNVPFPWYKKILLAPIAFLFMRSSKEGSQNLIHAVLEDKSCFRVSFFKHNQHNYGELPL